MAYRRRRSEGRREMLAGMAAEAQDLGIYDAALTTAEVPDSLRRFLPEFVGLVERASGPAQNPTGWPVGFCAPEADRSVKQACKSCSDRA